MLGRFAFVRLKAAENALKDGRLDEAFQILRADDLRDHRRAQKLLTRLSEAFLDRARSHQANAAYGEALLDLDRSEEAGGKRDVITDLRQQIRRSADVAQLRRRFRRDRIAAARERLHNGSLRAVDDILTSDSDGSGEAARLREQAARRRGEAEQAATEAGMFFDAGQIDRAVERCLRALSLDSRCPQAVEVEGRICRETLDRIRTAVRDGRLDQASRLLDGLGLLGPAFPGRQETAELLDLARRAAQAIGRFEIAAARDIVQRLKLLAPDAAWIAQAHDQLHQANDVLSALRAGPMALAIGQPAQADPEAPTVSLAEHHVAADPSVRLASTEPADMLPERLLLIVDGAASFLLLRKDRVSVGRINADEPADVGLVADLSDRHAEIARIEDDYFLSSSRDVEVGGRPVRHKLLADGDKIRLSRRAELTFRLPSRRSTSAVLDLGEQVRSVADVRRVILFDGHATLGSSSSCHLNVPLTAQNLLLFERGGRLWLRTQESGNSHPAGTPAEAMPLPLGRVTEIGGLRLVLETPAAGSRTRKT